MPYSHIRVSLKVEEKIKKVKRMVCSRLLLISIYPSFTQPFKRDASGNKGERRGGKEKHSWKEIQMYLEGMEKIVSDFPRIDFNMNGK